MMPELCRRVCCSGCSVCPLRRPGLSYTLCRNPPTNTPPPSSHLLCGPSGQVKSHVFEGRSQTSFASHYSGHDHIIVLSPVLYALIMTFNSCRGSGRVFPPPCAVYRLDARFPTGPFWPVPYFLVTFRFILACFKGEPSGTLSGYDDAYSHFPRRPFELDLFLDQGVGLTSRRLVHPGGRSSVTHCSLRFLTVPVVVQ